MIVYAEIGLISEKLNSRYRDLKVITAYTSEVAFLHGWVP